MKLIKKNYVAYSAAPVAAPTTIRPTASANLRAIEALRLLVAVTISSLRARQAERKDVINVRRKTCFAQNRMVSGCVHHHRVDTVVCIRHTCRRTGQPARDATISATWLPTETPTPQLGPPLPSETPSIRPTPIGVCRIAPGCTLLPVVMAP